MYSLMSIGSWRSRHEQNSARARESSVLPTPVGPRKMNEPNWAIRVLQTGAGAANGIGNGFDRFVLTTTR